jgi:hypothetical protein
MHLDHVQKYGGERRKVACGGGGLLSQSSVTVCQIQSQSQFPIPLSHFLTRPPLPLPSGDKSLVVSNHGLWWELNSKENTWNSELHNL